jgi:hypothetical protein
MVVISNRHSARLLFQRARKPSAESERLTVALPPQVTAKQIF